MSFISGFDLINCDLLYSGMPKFPQEGEEVYSKGFDIQLGGGMPAIMINLARLNVPVRFSTFLGNDIFSAFARKALDRYGVKYRNLYRGTGMPVTVTSVAVTRNERTFISYHCPIEVTDNMKESMFEQAKDAKIIRMSNCFYDVCVQLKKENPNIVFVMDTGWDDGMSLEKYGDYLALADYYTPNSREATKITGTNDVFEAAKVLSQYFKSAIIKLGSRGCLLRQNGRNEIVPERKGVKSVDETGAGDAFSAGLIYGLFHGYAIRDCIVMGNITGGECVKKVGCLSGYLTEDQLLKIAQGSGIRPSVESEQTP